MPIEIDKPQQQLATIGLTKSIPATAISPIGDAVPPAGSCHRMGEKSSAFARFADVAKNPLLPGKSFHQIYLV